MTLAKRRSAAKKHQPAHIKLLLVAEAPPCDGERYFYYENKEKKDWVYAYTWQAIAGEKPAKGDKPANLKRLRDSGVFLVDLHEEEVSKPKVKDLEPFVPELVTRIKKLNPDRVALVKASVHDAAFGALADADLPVINERIPFPASGQQKKYVEAIARAAEQAGVTID